MHDTPLPYRSGVYVVVAVLLWATKLHAMALFETTLGRRIPHTAFHAVAPQIPSGALHDAVFELDGRGHLRSHNVDLDIVALAPTIDHVRPKGPIRSFVNGERQGDVMDGPTLRVGNGYTFAYMAGNSRLVAVWGPGIRLHLVDHERVGGLFVNVLAAQPDGHVNVESDMHPTEGCRAEFGDDVDLNTLPSTTHRVAKEMRRKRLAEGSLQKINPWISTVGRVSDWYRDKKDFKIVIVYDNTFCALHGNDAGRARTVLQAMFRTVARLFWDTKAAVALEDIKGSCNRPDDPFKRPAAMDDCVAGSKDCSRSSFILDNLRQYFRFRNDFRRRDAIYLVTGYESGNSVIGAAFLGAACNTDYAYGWVHGADPVVMAHELGHTLSATHGTGIMRDTVKPGVEVEFSDESIDAINDFMNTVWDSWCLGSWDRYYSYGDKTLIGLSEGDHLLEGTDITFADVSGPNSTDLIFLQAGKQNKTDALYFSFAMDIRRVAANIFRFKEWGETYAIPGTRGDYSAGGGIAFGNIRSPTSKDVIVSYILSRKKAFFKLGFGIDIEGVATGGWSRAYPISMNLGGGIRCMGLTVADVRGRGVNDLVLVYVKVRSQVNYAFYVIGFDMGADGVPRGGWTEPRQIPGWLGYFTGDISVALYDTSGSGKMDLVIHSNERWLGVSRGSFRIGRDLDEDGFVSGLWSTTIPAPGSPLVAVMPKITGGIAISKIGKEKQLTTAILQSVTFPERNRVVTYLELGFDLLEAAEAEVNVSTIKNILRSPASKCTECYKGTKTGNCERRFEVCNVAEYAFPLETVSIALQRTTPTSDAVSGSLGPDTESIFCEGFHDLFVERETDACRSDIGTEDVMSAGAAGVIRDEIVESLSNVSITVEYEIIFETRKGSLFIEEKHRNVGPQKLPHSVKIYVQSSSSIWKQVVKKAAWKFSGRSDFSNVFDIFQIKARRGKNGTQWVIIVNFDKKFKLEFFKEDQLRRVAG